MANQIVVSAGAKVRNLDGVLTGTSGVVNSLPINASNGIPQLDVNGKILVSQLPNSVMEYQGTWNANTNTPTLVNGTGNQGDVYLCNVAGTVDFGAGPIAFVVGDQVIYSGSIWQRASGATGTVTSVAVTESGDSLNITGSPITTSGTINIGFNGTNLQYVNGAGNLTTFPTLITSIGLSMPSAFSVANSPLTANGTIAVTGAGYASQYIRGDGTLADFPSSGGGGSSVSYYLNGGTSQGTIGGTTYYEMSKTADTGTGVDFTKSGDGFIVAFLTDANDPAQLNIPAGNWNYEIYASMSANGGTPQMYAELYKYDGTTFTLISTSTNEILYDGTNLNLYTFGMTVPATTLTLTDRLAIKLYATNSGGKTTTVHTQDSHLCQIITTFSTGITALNGLTAQVQYFQTGTSGTDFNISSTTATHTFNLPTASAANRGALSSADWSIFNGKQNALTLTTTGTSGAATLVGATLNIPQYQAAGTYVTSVTGTSPIVSSGGTTPAISIPVATSSANGYLSSTDWSTFNGKIGGGGTANYIPKFSGTFSIADSIIYDNSGNVLINTTDSSIGHRLAVYSTTEAAQLRVMGLAPSVLFTESTTNTNSYVAYLGVVTSVNNFYTGSFIGDFVMSNNSNYGIAFAINNSQKLRIANTGAATFASSVTATSFVKTSGTSSQYLMADGSVSTLTNPVTGTGTTNYLPKFTGTSTIGNSNLINDALGNLGLGVTPSAWSGFTAFDIGSTGNLASYGSGADVQLNANAYYSGASWIYKTTTTAGRFRVAGNEFQWYTAPSGTAGNAITFTQAMTLFSTGNLAVGTTTDAGYKLDVNGTGRFTGNLRVRGGTNFGGYYMDYQSDATSRSFRVSSEHLVFGDFVIQRSTTRTGTTYEDLLYFDANRAATFSSSVTAGGNLALRSYTAKIFLAPDDYKYIATSPSTGDYLAIAQNPYASGIQLGFSDATTPTTFNPKITVLPSGNVGIGTTSPTNSISGTETTLQISNSNAAVLSLESTGAGGHKYAIGSLGGALAGVLGIYDVTASAYRLQITSGGNVLIGTTTDAGYKLYVDGGSSNGMAFYSTSAANQFKIAGTAAAMTFTNTISAPSMGGSLGVATSAGDFLSGTAAGDTIFINQFSGKKLYAVSYSGGVYLSSGATSWTANSDIRLKNINSHIENAVEKLSTLQTINFSYKNDKFKKQNLGLIAQEVEKIFPELIDKNDDEMLGVRYTELVPVLVKAIQEQQKEINELKQLINK